MARNHWIPIGHSSVEIKQTRRSLDAQGLVTIEIQKNRNAQCGAFQTKYWISLRFSRYRSHSHCTYLNKHFYAFLRARASPFDARIVFVCTFHARMSYHIVVATLSPQSTIQTKKSQLVNVRIAQLQQSTAVFSQAHFSIFIKVQRAFC